MGSLFPISFEVYETHCGCVEKAGSGPWVTPLSLLQVIYMPKLRLRGFPFVSGGSYKLSCQLQPIRSCITYSFFVEVSKGSRLWVDISDNCVCSCLRYLFIHITSSHRICNAHYHINQARLQSKEVYLTR